MKKQIDVEIFDVCDQKTKRKLKKINHKHEVEKKISKFQDFIRPYKKALKRTYGDTKTSVTKAIKDKLFWKLSFVSILCLFMLFNGFSWFYREYVSKGTEIKVGSLEHRVTQYDNNGNVIQELEDTSTLIYEPNMSHITSSSVYVSIENMGSLNMEYNLTFNLDGTIEQSGVMYYRVYDVTNEVNNSVISASNDTKIKAYANGNPIASNIETDTGNPISNLSTINNLIVNGIINKSENTNENIRYYRIDYGMYSATNTSLYSDSSVTLHYNVYSYQVGADIMASQEGEIWEVTNELQFRNAVTNAVSGDTIRLMGDVSIEGSVDIPRRIHLDLNTYDLSITGDLVYDFVESGNLNIDVTGKLDILNDLYINTPKSKLKLKGNNDGYDIYVAGRITLNGLQNQEEDGILLEDIAIIKNKTGNIPADLYIMSNTRLTVGVDVALGNVIANDGATNIEIINNGTILQIDLQEMTLLSTFTKPQIYIYNLNVIQGSLGGSTILVPSNATPYLGPNNGNTLIIRGMTSNDITVSGSNNFNNTDISSSEVEQNVIPIDGEDNSYKVYIRTSDAVLETLLEDYFESKNLDPTTLISSIEKLVVYTVNAQYLENEDFDFIKSEAVSHIEYLDISNSKVIDGTTPNRIKNGALENKTSLKTVILPKGLVEIGEGAFSNIELGKITANEEFSILTIPADVNSIGSGAFNAAKYVEFEGYTPPIIGENAFNVSASGTKVFVPSTSISLYQNTENLRKLSVFVKSELSDNRNYFVYKTINGIGISYFVSTITTGDTLTIPNTISLNSTQYNVVEIGVSSFANATMVASGTTVVLPTTVKRINDYAFYNQPVTGINFINVEQIGDYALYNSKLITLNGDNITNIGNYSFSNSTLQSASLENVTSIGDNAFVNNENLYEINLGNVKELGDRALYNCPLLGLVYFKNTDTRLRYNGEVIDLSLGVNSIFGNWGEYLDGRLRIYVPDGVSDNGNSYLSLYRDLFGTNTEYVYVTGEMVGSYSPQAMDYNFGSYSVRTVSKYNQDGVVVGIEIIEYHGADLTESYEIPTNLTLLSGVNLPVISIGEGAYRHVKVKTGETLNLNTNNIINISDYGFYNLKMSRITANNVLDIGKYAFTGTGLTMATFPSLTTLGNYALSNMETLYSLNLGPVKIIGTNAVANNPNLEQLFIVNTDIDNMEISGNPFTNLGTNVHERMRIYVPDGDIYTEFYKNLLGYEDYIYPTGVIVGSYINLPIQFNIGEYAIRRLTLNDYEGNPVDGYEIIDYHGADLTTTYNIPETLTYNGTTLPVISIGKGAYIHTVGVNGASVNLTSDNLIIIKDKAFNGVNGVNSFESNSLITLGKYAFNGSSLNTINVPKLNSIGSYALSDMESFYYANLGVVKNMEQNSLYELPNLSQVFFRTTNMELMFDENAINNVGENTNNRMRFYVDDQGYDKLALTVTAQRQNGWGNYTYQYNFTVTNTSGKDINGWEVKLDGTSVNARDIVAWGANVTGSDGVYVFTNVDYTTTIANGQSITFSGQITSNQQNYDPVFFDCYGYFQRQGIVTKPNYVDIYKALFNESYKNYFYAKGEIVGNYSQPNIPYDIGEYTVRKATYTDYSNTKVTGWEVVEYHGDDIMEGYMLPEALTVDNVRYDVIGIGDYAYRYATISDVAAGTFDLTNNSIKYIGEHAFDGVRSLKVLSGTSIETIGAYAFNDNVLYTVNLPNIHNIDGYAFSNNRTLNYANLGSVTSLGNGIFYNDTGLEQVFFTSTNADANTGTMNFTVGENIFNNAGTNTGNRFRIYVPAGNVTNNLSYADVYKHTFTGYEDYIYSTGTIIGNYTYSTMPYNIGNYMIREVNINDINGTSVNGWEIVDYHGPDVNSTYTIPLSFTVNGTTKNVIFLGDNSMRYINLEDGATLDLVLSNNIIYIGNNAFEESSINSIKGHNISYIGKYAFSECNNLSSVEFDAVKRIEEYAFYNNPRMTVVKMGNNVEYIGDYAFYHSYNSTKRSLYLNVTTPPTVGVNAFPERQENDNNGTKYYLYSFWIYVPATSVSTYIATAPYSDYATTNPLGSGIHITTYSENGEYVYNIINEDEIEIVTYTGNATGTLNIVETMTINNVTYNVTTINSDAFISSNRITGILIPRYVYNVGENFLNGNTSINSITVNGNNTNFRANNNVLFDYNYTTLIKYAPAKTDTTYTLPTTVTTIASNAFSNASNLTAVTFDSNLRVLSHNAFKNCSSLNTVTFSSTTIPYITGFNPFPSGVSVKVPNSALNNYKANNFLKGYNVTAS